MKYSYAVCEIKPAFLTNELISMGKMGWELIQVIQLHTLKPGIQLNGAPQIELTYQLIFKKSENDSNDNKKPG